MSGFPINPLPDDARCIAMGIACTAIGDRAEATGVNPAAAAGELTTSLNIQVRHAILETVYLDQEGLNAEALGTNQGQLYMLIDDSPTEISRAGINVPFGRWSLGGFYQKPIGFSAAGSRGVRHHPVNGSRYTSIHEFEAHMETIGITAAYRISDAWSAGVSLLSSQMDLKRIDRWEVEGVFNMPGQAESLPEAYFADEINGDDRDTVWQAGVIYSPDGPFSFGFAWREGESFKLAGQAVETYLQDGETMDRSRQGKYGLDMPGFWSLGVGWRLGETWLLSFEYVRIEHAELPQVRTHSLGLGVSAEHLTEPIDDTNSLRLGLEKVICRDWVINCLYLRLGMITEDDHDGMASIEGYDTQFTGGLGMLFGQRDQFSIDIAGLGGDEEILFVASLTYRRPGN